VEIAHVIARAVEMMSPLLTERRHVLVVDVTNVGLLVDGDEHRLAQVLSNLLSNAAHYTPAGGHITIAARRDGEEVVVDVSDDGMGIAAEELPHIFQVFIQGSSRSSGEGGLGLGLVVVKELVELHGGTVAVASAGEGRGSTFSVRLPALPSDSVAPPPPDPLAATPPTTFERVLMVDDNEDALSLLSEFVARAGHEVVTAGSGADALTALADFRASVALIDINMPGMNGYELAARILATHAAERPYLIALTGYGHAKDHARSVAAGFDQHLVKPVDLDELLRVISAHVTAS
jgi:CheY-like chemotaxis protein